MKNKADIRWTYILMILTLGLGACSVMDPLVGSSGKEGGGWIDWDGEAGWSDSAEPAAEGVAAGADSFAELPAAEPPVELEEAAVGAVKLESEPASGSQAPNLRAGSVDDNAEWDDYLLYRLRFTEWGIDVHDVDVTGRHTITVSNAQGQPVLGAEVTVLDENGDRLARLTTHSDGSVLFFPNAYPESDLEKLEIVVAKDGREVSQVMDREDLEHAVTLDAESSTQPLRLDVHFLIDATGSMSDEIAQLKENMIAVSEQIEALPSNPNVRFGMTIYRDRGDLFVSRTFDFTPDVAAFTEELARVRADGGGDYPESLNEGLHNAIHLPEWRGEATVSLIFLLADAPPHLDYAQDYDYAADVFAAAEMGIKIYPLASSGLDDQGEYVFRQLAQISSGKFLFLTYGAGGAPGDDTTHHVDDYSVLSLDELVVRMIEEELAPLTFSQ
ncbi:MAG: VWA domain-containing protein [Anaerolineales bacterium]